MRRSVFDGSFYMRDRKKLEEFIKTAMGEAKVRQGVGNAVSYVAPHAGYVYSGKAAAFTYKAMKENKRLEGTSTIIIVGPNHTGTGKPISVSMEDWKTPLGTAMNDTELSKAIAEDSERIWIDEQAHANEHSIEVQLPFIKCLFPEKKFVFICMGDQSTGSSEILAKSIINRVKKLKRNVFMVASSDLTHYEPADIAKVKDSKLLGAAMALDWKGFNRVVRDTNHTACGFGPMTVAMIFAKHEAAKEGIVLRYCNSGDITKDYQSVVAYASMAFV